MWYQFIFELFVRCGKISIIQLMWFTLPPIWCCVLQDSLFPKPERGMCNVLHLVLWHYGLIVHQSPQHIVVLSKKLSKNDIRFFFLDTDTSLGDKVFYQTTFKALYKLILCYCICKSMKIIWFHGLMMCALDI